MPSTAVAPTSPAAPAGPAKGQCSHGAGRATSWGGGNPILPSPLGSQASPGTTPGTPAGIRVPPNAGRCPPPKASCPPGAAHGVVTFVPTQGHLPARGSPLAPASIRVPGQAAQGFSAPLPLKSGQHRGETGEEVSDSTRRLRPLRPRGGPTAGCSEPCLGPMGAALPKPTFPRGVRPRLWLAARVAAGPAAKEGHEEAETGAGARAPAGAGAGAAAAAPHRAHRRFGASSEGAGERLLPPPRHDSWLSTCIWCCCNASETPQKAAALLISWEANERSR